MDIHPVLNRIQAAESPNPEDLVRVLRAEGREETGPLFSLANRVREEGTGPGILLRGIVEFSSHCRNACAYCGLNRNNRSLARYRMTPDEILATVADINGAGIRTVVLQSGEDDLLETGWMSDLIRRIKADFDTAVTLSVGERPREDYREWREAGADRYLLKIETTDPVLYSRLHPGMSFRNRTRCLNDLAELGYQPGSGNIVGLRGQSLRSLAEDIRFFQSGRFAMLGIGPFIPHPLTPLAEDETGHVDLSLRVLALTRIVTRNTHLPATTATASLEAGGEWARALVSGANVIMPNFTPEVYKKQYEIYPGRRGGGESPSQTVTKIARLAERLGRPLDFSRGDSLKNSEIGGSNMTFPPPIKQEEK